MKSQCKWRLFALIAALAIMVGAARTVTAYQYVLSGPTTYEYEDDPEDVSTSTRIEETSAIPGAQGDGDCSCSVSTYAWATDGDGAVAESEAYGTWRKSWQWDGPSGTAPGGTLSWSHSGGGSASVWGGFDLGTNGGAMSVAGADSFTDGSGSGTGSYGTSSAFGYVDTTTHANVYSDITGTGNPQEEFWSASDEEYYNDHYSNWMLWSQHGDGNDSIASGTSYVYFSGGAWCDNFSAAGAGPLGSGAESGGNTAASASVSLSASFTSN